jgi:hypothetical protein
MTEYEVTDLSIGMMDQVFASIGYYLTTIFAYLSVAYFMGDKLKKREVFIISVLFLFGVLIFLYGTYGYLTKHWEMVQQMKAIAPNAAYFNDSSWVRNSILAIELFGAVVSLYFMYTRTRRETN